MNKCCEHELRRYRQALDFARCEVIHSSNDFKAANTIIWAMEKANAISRNWRNGLRGRAAWMGHLPQLYRAIFTGVSGQSNGGSHE